MVFTFRQEQMVGLAGQADSDALWNPAVDTVTLFSLGENRRGSESQFSSSAWISMQ